MYVRLRKFAENYPMFIPILLLLICLACVWFFADRRSDIDESGIQRSTVEINNARQYNQRAVDDNRRTRTAVNRSIEITERTKGAITRSEEYINQARSNANSAKGLIGESRSILEHANERTKEGKSKVSQ